MNSKTALARMRGAMTAAAALVGLGLLILTFSSPRGARAVQSTAARLAARAEATTTASPGSVLHALRPAAPSGDIVRIVTTAGRSLGEALKPGVWTTAAAPIRGAGAATGIELSRPGAAGGGPGFGHAAAIVANALALLALLVAFIVTARSPDEDGAQRGRTRVSGPAPLPESDRRQLVGALMVVVETAPDSPAGLRALKTLKQVGVETIEPSHGSIFDPRLHCVCGVVEAPDPSLVDSVVAVVRPGYVDHGYVLREADVQIYSSAHERRHALGTVS